MVAIGMSLILICCLRIRSSSRSSGPSYCSRWKFNGDDTVLRIPMGSKLLFVEIQHYIHRAIVCVDLRLRTGRFQIVEGAAVFDHAQEMVKDSGTFDNLK